MAKPIRATPTLRGEDARNFIRAVLQEQRTPSPIRLKTLREAKNLQITLPQ